MNARLIAASALIAAAFAAPAMAQDAPTGASLFQQRCNVCHSGLPTAKGPSLKGVAGGKIADVKGYEFSTALSAKKSQKWTDANLDAYLADPKGWTGPEGKMAVKVTDAAQRKLIIAHLKTLK